MSEGIALFDSDDQLVNFNDDFRDIMLPSLGDVLTVGATFETLVREGAKHGLYSILDTDLESFVAIRLKDHQNLPSHREHQLGDGKWVRFSEQKAHAGGTILSLLDITDIKESELKAIHLQEQIIEVLGSLSEAFALFDPEDRLVLFNERYRELNEGISEQIIPGISFEEIIRAGIKHNHHPNAKGRIEEYVAERIAQHCNPPEPWEQKFEDGRWLRIAEYKTPSGAIAGLHSDITVQKRAEEALRTSEEKFSGILDIAPDAIITVDERGIIQLFNQGARDIFGYKEDEILAQPVEQLIPERFRAGHLGKILKFSTSGGQSRRMSERGEIVGRRNDGSEFPAEASISMLDLNNEKFFNVILRDITPRKRIERIALKAKETAEAASRTKSEFLANMSHELRTPLNAILGFSQIMDSESFGPLGNEKYKEYAKDIHDSGAHLLNLINDVLDLSRIEAGAMHLTESIVDVNEALRSTIRMVQERALRKSIQIIINLNPAPLVIRGDERAIKQIILNLLSNSVKFIHEDGTIEVSSRTETDGGISLIVTDTGVGVKASDLPKVLEPFGQVGDVGTRQHDGTGLGIPLSKRLAELHDATFELESEVGVGTTVKIHFPAERLI